jgi:hypothetical protein
MTTFETDNAGFTHVQKTHNDLPASGAALAQGALASLSQCQFEAARLMSRRARALLALPKALGGCRSVRDVAHVQVDYWQHFWADWLSTSQRMAAVWAGSLQSAGSAADTSRGEDRPEPSAQSAAVPIPVWEWWRIDMKGIVPRRSDLGRPTAGRNGTH